MDKFYTQRGARPDLSALFNLSTAATGGYVFPKLFPIMTPREKAGTQSYVLAAARRKGAAGRANGAELTVIERKTAALNWTTARLEGRTGIYLSECKGYDGVEAVDQDGGEDALTACMDAAEAAAHAKVFSAARTGAAVTLANASVIKILQQQAKAVLPYGQPVLAMSFNTFLDFINIPEVRTRLEIGTLAKGDIGFQAAQSPQMRQAVSSLLTIGDIYIFDNDAVGDLADDYIAVIGVRPVEKGKAQAEVRRKATYGLGIFYLPDGASDDMPFTVSSFDDRDNKRNVYDAEGYYSLNELNGAAVKMLKLDAAYTEPTKQVLIINSEENPVNTKPNTVAG